MPARPYADRLVQVRQIVLDRVAAGEPLMAVCAELGQPSYASVHAWGRGDPDFARALTIARAQGEARRRWRFDEAQAQALLIRLRAGEPITSILRDPAMPSRRVYARWRATQAPFQEEIHRLNADKAARGMARQLNPRRAFEPALADRIVTRVAGGEPLQGLLNSAAGLPCRNVVIRWRKEQPDFDQALHIAIRIGRRRARTQGRFTPRLTARIVDAIRQGESLASLGRRRGMPCASTLYTWVRTDQAFAAEVAAASQDREDWYADHILMASEEPGSAAKVAALRRRRARLQHRPGKRWRTS